MSFRKIKKKKQLLWVLNLLWELIHFNIKGCLYVKLYVVAGKNYFTTAELGITNQFSQLHFIPD